MLHFTDPSIPKNSGCFRPIRVIAPPGTVVNVDFPGPSVGGNTETHCRIAYIVIGALAPGLSARSAATDGAPHSTSSSAAPTSQTWRVLLLLRHHAGGWGGRASPTAMTPCGGINGNCPHIPTEVFETRFPWHVEEFRLVDGSGGPGKFRGGSRCRKPCAAPTRPMTYSYMANSPEDPALGNSWRLGGRQGRLADELERLRRMADRGTGLQQSVAEQVRQRTDFSPATASRSPGRPAGVGGLHPNAVAKWSKRICSTAI